MIIMVVDIIIKKSDKKDKNVTQSLMERRPFHLVLLVIVILQTIRMKKERNLI